MLILLFESFEVSKEVHAFLCFFNDANRVITPGKTLEIVEPKNVTWEVAHGRDFFWRTLTNVF